MAAVGSTFKCVDTIGALEHYAKPFPDSERRVLALGLDQTLIKLAPTLGDLNFLTFLRECHKKYGYELSSHVQWVKSFRHQIPARACETAEKVNAVISKFWTLGWSVCILSSRSEAERDLTFDHISQSGIKILEEEIIFLRQGVGKRTALIEWMASQRHLMGQMMKIRFLDYRKEHCEDVMQIGEEIVKCFQYTAAPAHSELDENQRRQLVVQLHAHSENRAIPFEDAYSDIEVFDAMHALGITELREKQIYDAIVRVAEEKKFPFKALG